MASIFGVCTTIGTTNLLTLFASVLFDRRIIITSSDTGKITSCIYALNALLFPLRWEHILIPIIPKHLLDYFMVGAGSSTLYAPAEARGGAGPGPGLGLRRAVLCSRWSLTVASLNSCG